MTLNEIRHQEQRRHPDRHYRPRGLRATAFLRPASISLLLAAQLSILAERPLMQCVIDTTETWLFPCDANTL